MTPMPELAVEALTRGIVNKIMHTPSHEENGGGQSPNQPPVIDLVRRLCDFHDGSRGRRN